MQNDLDPKGLEAALGCYSEGGCSGLDERERREVVTDIIETYLSTTAPDEGLVVARLHRREGLGLVIERLDAAWGVGAGLFDLYAVKVANADGSPALAASRLSQGTGVTVPNEKWSDREPLYEAAIAAYEANTPKDYRYSALAMVKAVDAVLAALSGDTL